MIAKKRKKKKLLVLKCLLAARWIENPFVRIFKIFYSYLLLLFFFCESKFHYSVNRARVIHTLKQKLTRKKPLWTLAPLRRVLEVGLYTVRKMK